MCAVVEGLFVSEPEREGGGVHAMWPEVHRGCAAGCESLGASARSVSQARSIARARREAPGIPNFH
jgi:hypothetical protein